MGSGVSRSLWPPDRIRAPLNIRFQVKGRMSELPAGDGGPAAKGLRASPEGSPAPFAKARPVAGSDPACWTISTGQLSALLRVHLRPIDVVVCHGPQGDLVSRGASRLDAFRGYPVRS